jgi:hypothetical protein
MAFIATIDGKELKIPVTVTGVELDQHNKESRQLVLKDFQSLETIVLPAGFQTLELRAEGVLENFEVPKGRANKKLCYSAFPMLEELRLEPVK